MYYYIGIDPSISNTGLAVLNYMANPVMLAEPGTWVLKKDKKHKILRYSAIADKLVEAILTLPYITDCIVGYEDYSFDSVNKAFSIGEMGGVLKTKLMEVVGIKVSLYLLPPKTLKLFATGYGAATKEQIYNQFKLEITKDYEYVTNDDIIDAYYLAVMASLIGKVMPKIPADLLRSRLEVLKKYLIGNKPITNYY